MYCEIIKECADEDEEGKFTLNAGSEKAPLRRFHVG